MMPGLGAGGFAPITGLAGLPSPAQGIPDGGVLSQIASAASNYPKLKQDDDARKLEIEKTRLGMETARTSMETARRKNAQDQIGQIQQMVKGNNALQTSKPLIARLKELYTQIGVPAPITGSQDGAAPSMAPGGAAPALDTMGPPDPNAAAGSSIASQPAAPGSPAALAAPPQPAPQPLGESIDLAAFVPQKTFADMDNAETKEAYSLTPEQRRARYGGLQGVTDSFLDAPRAVSATEYQTNMYAFTQALKSFGTGQLGADEVRGFLAAYGPKMRESGIDPQAFLAQSGVLQHVGVAAQARMDSWKNAGIITADKARAYINKTNADIGAIGTRMGYQQAETAMVNAKLKYVDQDMQTKIQQRTTSAQSAAARLKVAQGNLDEAIKRGNISDFRAQQSALNNEVRDTQTQISSLRRDAVSLINNGQEDAKDPITQRPMVDVMADQIKDLQGHLDDANVKLREAPGQAKAVAQRQIKNAIDQPSGGRVQIPPPPTAKVLTRDQLARAAKAQGISVDAAERDARSRGYEIR